MFLFSFFFLNSRPLLPFSVMISRTLGPEVGGSIGLMFYLANVCGCAVSLLGLVESVLDVFGAGLCSLHLV
jgi:amino acid transporter